MAGTAPLLLAAMGPNQALAQEIVAGTRGAVPSALRDEIDRMRARLASHSLTITPTAADASAGS